MKKMNQLMLVSLLFFGCGTSAYAGLFDSLTEGLKKTVNVVGETANHAIASVSNVVDVSVSVRTNNTRSVTTASTRESLHQRTTPQTVLPVTTTQQGDGGQVRQLNLFGGRSPMGLNRRELQGRAERGDARDEIMRRSANFLSGEFKQRAEKLMERDGGNSGERYQGSILRLWTNYVNVQPEMPCERVYRDRFQGMPDLVETGGAILPQSMQSAKTWVAGIRSALEKEESFFNARDERIRLAKLKEERQLAYNRDRDEIRGALAAFEGEDTSKLIQTGERGQLLAALMDAHLEIIQPMKDQIGEIKRQYSELPAEPNDKAVSSVADLKCGIKKIQDKLMEAVNDVNARGESNRQQLAAFHAPLSGTEDSKVEQLLLMPGVGLGDSLFKVLCCLKGATRMVIRPNEYEKSEVYGQTHVIVSQSQATKEFENFRLDFGAFSETQEVFLVRAKFGYVQDTELKAAVDGFKRMLPNSASCKEERQIVGYYEDELKGRNPWAAWQLEYYRERANTLKDDELRKKNLGLVDFTLNHYRAIPFFREKVTLEGAGYGIVVLTHPGRDVVEDVMLEDRVAADKVKLR